MTLASPAGPVADVSGDPFWLVLLKAVFVFVYLVVTVLLTIWAERRVIGRMQNRPGPNRAGPFGLLQSLADGVKLALKEDIIPSGVHRAVFMIAPAISTIPAFLSFAVIPFGPQVSIFGVSTPLQLTDLPVAVLYILAVASVGVYGIVLAGWASNSTYPLLGGVRSTAQVISYELAMGMSLVSVFIVAGSMSTSQIVASQQDAWWVLFLAPAFVIYVISMVGETNRAPFDLPEAEGELVGGFHTEYSSLKFALFFLAEYINMVTVSALATTLFLGGWRAPWPLSDIGGGVLNEGWWPILWFTLKVWGFLFLFIWLRGSLPRLRYDQFMKFGWKVLIPSALAWIVVVAVTQALRRFGGYDTRQLLFVLAPVVGVLVLAAFFWPERREEGDDEGTPTQVDPFAGGYPVPPLPGQVLVEPGRPGTAAGEPVTAGAASAPVGALAGGSGTAPRAQGSTSEEVRRG